MRHQFYLDVVNGSKEKRVRNGTDDGPIKEAGSHSRRTVDGGECKS